MNNQIILAVNDVVANWENVESVEIVWNDDDKPGVVAFFKSGRQTKLCLFSNLPDARAMLTKIRDDMLRFRQCAIDKDTRRNTD